MARLTLDQINALIPNDAQILQQSGITQTVGDDGNPVYRDAEGQKVNPGQVQTILDTRDQARQQALTQNGIIQMPSEQGDFSFFNRSNGTNFQNLSDYYNYLYGGGEQIGNVGTQDGSYYVLPEGQSTTDYKNAPLSYNPPPSTGYKLTQMGVLGLAGAGLGGFLPGTESVFGAAAGGAGGTVGGLSASDAALIDAANAGLWGGGEIAAGAGAGAGAAAGLGDVPLFTGGASGGEIAGAGGLTGGGLTGGASGAGVSGAVGGGLSGVEGAGLGAGLSNVTSGGSALSRLLDGTATTADYLQLAGGVGSSLLGAAGSNAQAGAYSDVADKYLALGAPYRAKLLETYAPGYSLTDSPDFKNALDVGAQAAARATSAKYGNPVDNPGAYSEMQKYISGSLVLPQLNTTRSQLGSFGQLGVNTAGTNDTQAASQTSGTYNALGYGLGQLTQPQSPFSNAGGALSKLLLNSSQYL